MLRTEDEAKQCWCPFARTVGTATETGRVNGEPVPVGASVNREPGEYDKDGNETAVISGRHRCIASACMAWRWRPGAHETKSKIEAIKQRRADTGATLREAKEWSERPENIHLWSAGGRLGWCGLAGKVEG